MMIPDLYPRKLPKAILFDWDNTLVDTWQTVYTSLNLALQGVGRDPLTKEEFSQKPHLSIRDSSESLFGEHSEKGTQIFHDAIHKTHLAEITSFQGAENLLLELKTRGIYVGIVSNKEGNFLRKEVAHLGWNSHFRRIIGARDTAEDKPSPIPVLAALYESTISPSHDVWFVGDSIVDVHCARSSGCIPVVVGDGIAAQQNDIVYGKDCTGLAQLIATL